MSRLVRFLHTHSAGRPLPLHRLIHTSSRFNPRLARQRSANRSTLLYALSGIISALGVSYASVPIYRLFCSKTGFAGTPVTDSSAFTAEDLRPSDKTRDVKIRVKFNADRSALLPWSFSPLQESVTVTPGQSTLAFYTATNNSDEEITGIATYNVLPERVAPFFAKVECFCFEHQRLLPRETVDLPLLFFIDKDIVDEPSCDRVELVVLNYSFFRTRDGKAVGVQSGVDLTDITQPHIRSSPGSDSGSVQVSP